MVMIKTCILIAACLFAEQNVANHVDPAHSCKPDACLKNIQDHADAYEMSTFCKKWSHTATHHIPPHITGCKGKTECVSSACACHMHTATRTPVHSPTHPTPKASSKPSTYPASKYSTKPRSTAKPKTYPASKYSTKASKTYTPAESFTTVTENAARAFTSTISGKGLTETVIVGVPTTPISFVTTTETLAPTATGFTSTISSAGSPTDTVVIGIPASSTTSTVPPIATCDNQGFAYAIYNNPFVNTDATYSTFKAEFFQSASVEYQGTTTYLGYYQANGAAPAPVYGSSMDFSANFIAINHRGYLYAVQSGTYTFTAPSVDDILLLWVDAPNAYNNYARNNANLIQYYADGVPTASYSVDLVAGTYTAIRLLFGNAQETGLFDFTVTAPDGTDIISSATTDPSPYLVQFSCDMILAPPYPPFGADGPTTPGR